MDASGPTLGSAISVVLRGPFRVIGPDGRDLTPVAQKAQAMLALLATSPSQRRARTWLCDKLWSDSDPERASGSLRQALAEVRRAFGHEAAALGTDRKSVWLHPGLVIVDAAERGEFLEGIDVRDPEWEDWLRARRLEDIPPDMENAASSAAGHAAHGPRPQVGGRAAGAANAGAANPGPARDRPVVSLSVARAADPAGQFLGGVVGELLARNLAESTGILADMDDSARATLSLTMTPNIGRDGPSVLLSLRRRPDGTHLWSAARGILSSGTPRQDDLALHALLAEAQDAIAANIASATPTTARGLSDIAIETQRAARRIMAYDTRRMPEIEARLEAMCDAEPNAATLGWLLLLKRIMFYERAAIATVDWIAHLAYRCEQAIALGNTNAFVLAAVSGAYLRLAGRPLEAVELAWRAFKVNPSNPFALDALASAMYLTGKIEEGCALSSAARKLTANTSYSHFFDMSLSMASLLAGQHDKAARLSTTALALAPDFRAAWRARIALSARAGNLGDAVKAGERLKQIEPDFSLDRMVRDPDYPVATLRQTCADGFDRLGEIA